MHLDVPVSIEINFEVYLHAFLRTMYMTEKKTLKKHVTTAEEARQYCIHVCQNSYPCFA